MPTIQSVAIIPTIYRRQMSMKSFLAEVSVPMTQGITPPLYTQVTCSHYGSVTTIIVFYQSSSSLSYWLISIFFLDGELYSGTVADFSASDSLIIKNVTSAKKWDNRLTRLRTEQYDFKQLNGNYNSHFINFVNYFQQLYYDARIL